MYYTEKIIEKREHKRFLANYIAELWIMDKFDFKDVGFRGTIRDFCSNGAYITELININVKGLNFKYTLKRDLAIKLIIYVPGKTLNLKGKIAWVSLDALNKSLGLTFTEVSEEVINLLLTDIQTKKEESI